MRGRRAVRGGRGHGRNHDGGHGRNHHDGVVGHGDGAGIAAGRGRFNHVGRGGRGRHHGPEPPHHIVPPMLLVEAAVQQQADENDPHQNVPFQGPNCPRCNPLPPPGEVNITSADDMLIFGLGLMALKAVGSAKTNKIQFRAHYGIDPEGILKVFTDLKEGRESIDPCGLLMAVNFLRCYETEPCMASRWGLGEERIRTKVREYVLLIQQLKNEKVCWQQVVSVHFP